MPSSKKLNAAFRTLRKLGILARQNVMCCSGCAQSELFGAIETGVANGKSVPLGVVFYHGQDAEDRDALRDFYVAFCSGHPNEDELPIPAEQVARIVVAVLAAHGVKTKWSGRANTRIKVVAESLWAGEDWYEWHKHVQAEKDKRTKRRLN